MKPKLKIGSLVEIEFSDYIYTENGVGPSINCRVIGEITNLDETAIYISSWLTNDSTNMDSHTILRSDIIKINTLKRK